MKPRPETELLYLRLRLLVRERRLYLDKDLTRDDLAREALTNRTYITKALKSKGLTFTAFIGEFRMQRALELLRDDAYRDVPREDIAVMSGFGSADVMNRYIKKSAGETACALRRRLFGDD